MLCIGNKEVYINLEEPKKGWIVINTKTNNHAHFRSEKGCRTIIALLRKGIEPNNTYLKESYERLTDRKY